MSSKIEQIREDYEVGKDLYKKILRNEDFEEAKITLSDIELTKKNSFIQTDEIFNHNGKDYNVFVKNDKKYIRDGHNAYTNILIYTKEHNLGSMPTFCPICKKFMRYGVDQSSWHSYNMCHHCWADKETKMKIDGTYEEWSVIQLYKTRRDKICEYILELKEKKNIDPKNITMGVTEMGDVLKYELKNSEEIFQKIEKEIERAEILIEIYDQIINKEIPEQDAESIFRSRINPEKPSTDN